MTKKIISFCFVVLHIFLLTACVEAKIVKKDIFFNTMNTFVNGHFYSEEQKAETLASEVKALFDTYDMLTDNFQQKGDVKGIYYINKAVEEGSETTTIEIDEKLYELIEFGLEVTVETDGYFDMSIGKIIDVWKELIEDYQTEAFVPEDILEATILAAEAIEIIEDPIQLEVIEGNHFITVKKGAKLDLGAIVKGYVLQKVVDYLESEGVQSYLISAGSSSLAFGEENPNRDSGNYVVGLINPLNPLSYYATYEAQGINITTSGSYEQYVEDEAGNWYHHIISPKTKKPAKLYYTLTIMGKDAGLLDAYSTALFCMTAGEIEAFLADKDLEVVVYHLDESVSNFNQTDAFQLR